MTTDKDFLERSLINEQETVRDYQRFSELTNNPELRKMFKEFAESEGVQAQKIKNVLENWSDE
ncbi:MAG: ferritin family protein [Bacillota bacterium]|nr:ferritin family protein [Bacillota bacterium]